MNIKINTRATSERLLKTIFLYLVVGYAIYVFSLALPTPKWATDLVHSLKPVVKSLSTADRINENPFPVQIIILYTAFSSIAMTAYITYILFSDKSLCSRGLSRCISLKITVKKLFWLGVFALLAGTVAFPLILFIHSPISISWQAASFFSSTISSITFLLLSTHLPVSMISLGLMCFKLALLLQRSEARP